MGLQKVGEDRATNSFTFLSLMLLGFPGGSVVKNLPVNARDGGSISGSGKSPGGGNGNPFQYSGLENSMHRRALRAPVHGVATSRT